jgi:outer membrane receptor protein involved in Fe transport
MHYSALSGDRTRLSTRMYYYHHEQTSDFNQSDAISQLPEGLTTHINGDKVGFITQVDHRFSEHHRVVGGADLQFDVVESSPDTIMYGDRQINNYAVFAQDDITLAKSITATLGARYDWNHLVGGKTIEQLSPKVALVWSARKNLALRALFAQAFRAPTIAELFLQRELGGGITFVPNPNLGAEHIVDSEEVGVRWNPKPVFGLDAAAFRYHYEDMIYWVLVGASPVRYQVQNLNSALMSGAEATVTSTLRALTLSANYTFLDARDQSPGRTDDKLAYRPRHTANFGADLGLGRRWMLHGDARYRSKIEEVFLFESSLPDAYWVFNSNLQYKLSDMVLLSAKVNNILDEQYEELARYRMPGRNYVFGVSLRF